MPKHSNVRCWVLRFPAGQSSLTVLRHQSYCTLSCATAWPWVAQRRKNHVPHLVRSGLYVRLDSALHSHSHDLASPGGSMYWLAL